MENFVGYSVWIFSKILEILLNLYDLVNTLLFVLEIFPKWTVLWDKNLKTTKNLKNKGYFNETDYVGKSVKIEVEYNVERTHHFSTR